MPHFHLETSVSQDKIPADMPAKLCQIVADTLGKELKYVCVSVIGGVSMSWSSTDDPTAQATLMSMGSLGPEENIKHSKVLFDYITDAIGIASDRMYIRFDDKDSSYVGYEGTTCKELFG